MERNSGFSRAVNAGAARAGGEALVLLNDDCVVDPDFLERLVAALDPAAGVGMAAAVMRDWAEPDLIDSAGMELDRTLLVWDYLNGEPLSLLDSGVPDPVGPSAAAAAFDAAAFRAEGGFDERLFAYWEDVDLVLRLRRAGFVCRLARDARGTHEHSASFRSGSARKNYLTGYGRGYVLRKWGAISPGRLGPILARDVITLAGQAVIDRTLSGGKGRAEGWRAAEPTFEYPANLPLGQAPKAHDTLRRRLQRRSRLRSRQPPANRQRPTANSIRSIAFFHLAGTSGPSRSLERELEWLGGLGDLQVVVPGPGAVADLFGGFASVATLPYDALNRPPGRGGTLATLRTQRADVARFRELIRAHGAGLVVVATAMLPAALVAARRERVPAVVYCGELFAQRGVGGAQLLARRAVARLTARLAAGIVCGSETVAAQFEGTARGPVAGRLSAGGRGVRERRRPGLARRARHRRRRTARRLCRLDHRGPWPGPPRPRRRRSRSRAARAPLRDRRRAVRSPAGPRSSPSVFDRLVAELGLEEVVSLPGHVDDVPGLLAAADAVVNPARFDEPFGRIPFEASLAGTPAVVTRVGAADELYRDGENALVVPPEDPEAIAAAIERLLADPALGERIVASAAAFTRERLSPEASVAGFRSVVEAVLASPPQ